MEDLRTVATEMIAKGWHPIMLPTNAKWPPEPGYTGSDGMDMTQLEIDMRQWEGNIGTRCPEGVIGIDVDHGYLGPDGIPKTGLTRLFHAGIDLPPTWISTSRPRAVFQGRPSGIYWYRYEEALEWKDPFQDVEVIHRNYRYAVMSPSQVDDRTYTWISPDGENAIPKVSDLPILPIDILAHFAKQTQTDRAFQDTGGTIPVKQRHQALITHTARAALDAISWEECWERLQRDVISRFEGKQTRDYEQEAKRAYEGAIAKLESGDWTVAGGRIENFAPVRAERPRQNMEIFDAHPQLALLRDWAFHKLLAPWALLGSALPRIAAEDCWTHLILSGDGSTDEPKPGSLFVAAIGDKGSGKSETMRVQQTVIEVRDGKLLIENFGGLSRPQRAR